MIFFFVGVLIIFKTNGFKRRKRPTLQAVCVLFIHSLSNSLNIKHFLCVMYWVRAVHYISRELSPASGTNGITITRRVGERRPEAEAIFVVCILPHGGLRRQEGRYFGGPQTAGRTRERDCYFLSRKTEADWSRLYCFLTQPAWLHDLRKGYLIVNKRIATIYCLLYAK